MAVAIDPAVATVVKHLHCAVETESALTRGMVVIDLLEFHPGQANADVVLEADRERFLTLLRESVR